MARSSQDDPMYSEWNYRTDTAENCAPGSLNERKQSPISAAPGVLNDNSVYSNTNYPNDIYKRYNAGDNAANSDGKTPFNNLHRANRQNYGNAMLDLGNGQLVRVIYDENNQQLIVPMNELFNPNEQYELFNPNQGLRDLPLHTTQPSHMFTLTQDYSVNNNNNVRIQQPNVQTTQTSFNQENNQHVPTSNFLKEVLGNWEPNSTGTYSPFGQNYPLNHPDAPTLNSQPPTPMEPISQAAKVENSPKRNETSPLADTSNKKRIVAEVKPMRPTYSDVLAKNTKNNAQTESTRKPKAHNIETKATNNKTGKPDKPATIKHDENKQKSERKLNASTVSSGSESGDFTTDDIDKCQKPNKKSKSKRSNNSRKWPSLDDITNEEDNGYNDNNSQFVFIENQSEKPLKKEKKSDRINSKYSDKNSIPDNNFKLDDNDESSQFVLQEGQGELKSKKKKDRSFHKAAKPAQDKKKTAQIKLRRNKPGYLGLAQGYLENWMEATWKAVVWFLYLLSDICRMSAHLSFDLCASVLTQTYVSSQAVWRSSKDYLSKIGHNKYLKYIDSKIGHTRLGFWRKLKWFKKETDTEKNKNSNKLQANIPLPSTGEEAMKRLLACKGKDPYSILGVSVSCTDEEIKRYYRRQAFLVHPDKNQQPGAEEAFKILQHAFDLIGEPERREAYERRALESRHVEAAWGELSKLLAQLHDKMEFAANTIRCTNCGRRHKRVATDRPCYAARYCAQCKIRHSAKEGDIWAESSLMGMVVMYYACMDGAVYQITQWASCQKRNLKQLRPDCHVVQYRIVLGNKAAPHAADAPPTHTGHDPNLEEFLNNLCKKSSPPPAPPHAPPAPPADDRKRRGKKNK